MKHIDNSDLKYFCENNTEYLNSVEKNICEDFLKTHTTTNELLKIYCVYEIECTGDMEDGIIEFQYEDITIKGEWDEDGVETPVKILSIG